MEHTELTKYETARILGARALQIAMNAPLLIKISQEDLEKIKFDAIKIAEVELNSGVLPIKVNRPLPQAKEGVVLKKIKETTISDEELAKEEAKVEAEIKEGGEIMTLANNEEESEEESSEDNE